MQSHHENLPRTRQYSCVDNQYRRTFHGPEQRYVSPTTGRCRPLVVQAVHPKPRGIDRIEAPVGETISGSKKLAIWLVIHPPSKPEEIPIWLVRWTWFTLMLVWPSSGLPRYTGLYPTYFARYYGQLWVARSPAEHTLRRAQGGVESVREITHTPYPRRLIIRDPDPESTSWHICSDESIIKRQRYVAVSYRYDDIIPRDIDGEDRIRLQAAFIMKVEAVIESLHETAYWIDLTLIGETTSHEEINQDLYRMADVYRGAQFTLIMLCPPAGVTEEQAWMSYGERLWTFPEALLSRELRFKLRDGEVMPITLHQLANRAYANLAEESAIINSYGLRDPLERLERLLQLKSALWRRTSNMLHNQANEEAGPFFMAERVYALMGFFEHRILPHFQETELQALVRLSMANDNDRIVERMVSLLHSQSPDTACWYAENDEWGLNLWDIEPEVQVVGLTKSNALVLGGCRAATIRWKDFPSVVFATRHSVKRLIATFLPNTSWLILLIGILLKVAAVPRAVVAIVIGALLILFAPLLVAYGSSGRIVHAQPWLVGVKGLISAEEASDLMYGGAIAALPRTSYSPSGTLLSRTETGQFRRGDPAQLDNLRPQAGGQEDDDLYTLVDTVSATIYYFRAARPPTVCLFMGRESGMGRFVLCSERCTINELHKETVIRMPWYISQFMPACDWVALN